MADIEPIDYGDPDDLIREAWIDSKKITDAFLRLQIKLKLVALSVYYTARVEVDVEIEEDEGEV